MAYQAILRVYKGFSGGGWPRAWRGVRVADMGGRTTPLRSPYKPGQVPHSAHTRLKSQQAAFPLGEEVRISRLGLKPAPRSEKADIGSTENERTYGAIKRAGCDPGPMRHLPARYQPKTRRPWHTAQCTFFTGIIGSSQKTPSAIFWGLRVPEPHCQATNR